MPNKPGPMPGGPAVQTWPCIDCYLHDRGVRIGEPTAGGTVAGGHVAGSYHYKGQARDYGDANSDCWAVYNALLPLANFPGCPIIELFWRDLAWKNGTRIGTIAGHYNHVHAAATMCIACSDDGTGTTGLVNRVKQAATDSCAPAALAVVAAPISALGALGWWRFH